MKFLIFTSEYPPMRTGVAAYNEVIADGLIQRGHEVTVLTFRPHGARAQQTLAQEVRLPVGAAKWLEVPRIVLGLASYRRLAPRFDATLLSSDLAQRIAGDFPFTGSTPFVCAVHGSEVTKRHPARSLATKAGWQLRLRTLQRAARVAANSGYTRDLLISAGLASNRIEVVYTGIPEIWFTTGPDIEAVHRLRRKLNIGAADLVILTLARIVERKGHDRVLRALKRAVERNSSVRYVVVGAGEDMARIRRLTDELNLGDRVIFTGEIPEDEKRTYYDLCDIFVMPSLHDGRRVEGLGLSFIEAAARRKPSIGGNHGGVPEVIEDSKTGYLIDPDDIETLTERLSTLAGNAKLRQQLGEAAYRFASERFRDTTMVASIERLLTAAALSATSRKYKL